MRRERGNGRLLGLLLLLAMLRDARAQDYCVDHYWVPGTGARGTTEESCQSMQPKDGWCGESASNCEGSCGGVWCTASPCVDVDNGLMGRFSYTCASIGDNLDKCTGYDANGFVAGDMCCQCGGGALQLHVLPSHALQFGQGTSEYELQLDPLGATAVAGFWTLSAWAMYTADYDGCKRLMHSRWWSGAAILGTTGNGCEGQIGWPSTADTWEWVSETFDTGGVVPSSTVWFVGYNQGNTAGNSYITDLQITGPDGSTWLNDGTFDGGVHMSLWSQPASQGAYSVVSTPQRDCPSCVVCPAGRYSGGTGCSVCPAGSVTDTFGEPGAATCAACPPGRYSQAPQLACRDCSAGSFTNTLDQPGATNCSTCPAGQYSPSVPESCQPCPIGQYTDVPNSTNCTLCGAGSMTDTHDRPGATRCDVLGRNCAGKVHCEWVEGPARFLCAFGSSLAHEGYRALQPWEFDLVGDVYNDGNMTLVLTESQPDQMGLARYRLPDPPQWLTGMFAVQFEMYVGDGNGADGMCVNLGDQSPASVAEDGVAMGVSLCFDEHPNAAFENGVDLFVNGVAVWEERAECNSGCHPMTLFEDARWHDVELTIASDATGGMTIAFEFDDGVLNGTAHVDNFERLTDQESWLMFSARTGGATNNHWVRNVAIREGGVQSSSNLTLRSFASPTCSAGSGGAVTGSFVLGGSNVDYPGFGCLAGENHQTLEDRSLQECQAACSEWSECKSFDFYVGRTGHTCSLSTANFQMVGSTTETADCRYYERTGSTGGDIQPPKLGVAFSSDFLCELSPPSPAPSRKVVHAPPALRAVARVVQRQDLERLDGLPHAVAAKRVGLNLPCYERLLTAMNDNATKQLGEVALATMKDFEYVGCGEEQPPAQSAEKCLRPDYVADGPESAYWAAILANQSCHSTSMVDEALARLRAKFAGCAGVEHL
jgi:hypothetical protein